MGTSQSKGVRVTKQDRAVLDLKVQRDRVRQYQRKLQQVLDREHDIARQAVREGHMERARLALRQRAYQNGLIEKTDQQLATLQELVRLFLYLRLTPTRYLLSSSHSLSKVYSMASLRVAKYSSRSMRKHVWNVLSRYWTLQPNHSTIKTYARLRLHLLMTHRKSTTCSLAP